MVSYHFSYNTTVLEYELKEYRAVRELELEQRIIFYYLCTKHYPQESQ